MDSVDTGMLVPSQSRYITELLEPGTEPRTAPIPGQLVAPPLATERWSRPNVSLATESGQTLALGVPDPQAAPPVELHALDLRDGEHGVRHESVIAEQGVIEPPLHPDSVEPRTKTVGDVLRHAARIIEERGWQQDSLGSGDGPYCAWGGISVAAGTINSDKCSDLEAEALDSVSDYLGLPLPIFNDDPGRTAAEVITALRAAADEYDR